MPNKSFGQVATNKLEIIESPLTILPGMEPVFSVTIAGSGTLDVSGITTPMKLYKGTKDVSSTSLSGSVSIPSGSRTFVCKKIVSLTPGDYAFFIYFNDGGVLSGRFCRFSVPKEVA